MTKPTKQPERLSLQRIFNILDGANADQTGRMLFNQGLAMAVNAKNIFQRFVDDTHGPYLLDDYRFVYVKRGWAHSVINLQDTVLRAGTVAILLPGTIANPLEFSDDLLITGIGVSAERFLAAHRGVLPNEFAGQTRHEILRLTEAEEQLVERLLGIMWALANTPTVSLRTLDNMLVTVTQTYDDILKSRSPTAADTVAPVDRGHQIFRRFIELVNRHCRQQHQLDYYADRLCLTKRHLGTVVRQTSGETAKQWIDKAIITAAKVTLAHTDKTVQQIADDLSFPTVSFFCKYFKRIEGVTPQEWRKARD